jgi:hypothetical protein
MTLRRPNEEFVSAELIPKRESSFLSLPSGIASDAFGGETYSLIGGFRTLADLPNEQAR